MKSLLFVSICLLDAEWNMITVRIIGEEESREEKKSTEWISTEKDNKYSIPKESLSFVHCLCCVTRPFPVEKTDGMKMRLKRD